MARPMDYDREYRPRRHRRRRRLDAARGRRRAEPIPDPWGGIYPPVSWGGGAIYGLEGGGPSPFALYGPSPYDDEYDTRRPPEAALHPPPHRSPTYGRHADPAARRWAEQHGFGPGYALRPRGTGGRYRWRGRPRRPGGAGHDERARG